MEYHDPKERKRIHDRLKSDSWRLYKSLNEGALPRQEQIVNILLDISKLKFELGTCIIFMYLTCSRREEILPYTYVSDKYEPLFRVAGYPLPITKPGVKRKNIQVYEDADGNVWVHIVTRNLKQSSHNEEYSLEQRYKDLTAIHTKNIDLLYHKNDPDYKLIQVLEEYIDIFDDLASQDPTVDIQELELFPTVKYSLINGTINKYKLNLHAFRKMRATHLSENGYNFSDLMATGGWKSPAMPGIYASSSKESRMSKLLKNIKMKSVL